MLRVCVLLRAVPSVLTGRPCQSKPTDASTELPLRLASVTPAYQPPSEAVPRTVVSCRPVD